MRPKYFAITIIFCCFTEVLAQFKAEEHLPFTDKNFPADTTAEDIPLAPPVDKSENLPALILGGIGYSSTNRTTIEAFIITGVKAFETNKIVQEVSMLRFDIQAKAGISIGASSALLLLLTTDFIIGKIDSTASPAFIRNAIWISSGSTLFNLYGNNILGFSLIESHIIEWWMYRDENKNFHFSEFGFTEELGIRANLGLAFISGGVQFEITNRRKHCSWFVKLGVLTIPAEDFQNRI